MKCSEDNFGNLILENNYYDSSDKQVNIVGNKFTTYDTNNTCTVFIHLKRHFLIPKN